MRKTMAASLVVLVVLVAQGWADEKARDAKLNDADREFVEKVGTCCNTEVKLSEMATKSASRAEVKEFAKVMVDDHTKGKQQFNEILKNKSITPPTTEAKNFKEVAERLSAAKGADFDAAYLEQMIKSHEEAIKLFETYSKDGNDADLKKWATTNLPTLKEHLEKAKKLAAQK